MDVVVIGMIYKSPTYLEFMLEQMDKYCVSEKWSVKKAVICNDGTDKIEELVKSDTRIDQTIIYHDPFPGDYYLNRVYRAWNYSGFNADGDIIVFVNSDMAFSPGWLDSLLDGLDDSTIPTSRLVESGKMPSGQYGISFNFGQTAKDYNEDGFLAFVDTIKTPRVAEGGLYMPVAFYKRDFIKSGGYPEGNIYEGGAGNTVTPFVMSGDKYYFDNSQKRHITIFDSIVYHIQEGELDE